ncbi:MAG TPA: hypothetical protein VG099_13385 [Gemmataceae bacterium]|nr:hypothetical protein [Gemmataceae bacterium]
MRLPTCLAGFVLLGIVLLSSAQAPPPPKPALRVSGATSTSAAKAMADPVAKAETKAAPAPDIGPWIEQLANRDFRTREAAVKEIMKIGVPALPALQKAKEHRDAEARRRIDEMIVCLERAAALAPKLVTLKMDKKSVRDVLNELSKQSGFKIPTTDAGFNGPQGKALHSFQFDKTPFWEALDKVCEKCGMIVNVNAGDNSVRVNFQDSYEPFRSYDGSFKVLATGFNYSKNSNFGELPKTPYQAGEQAYESLQLNLQVCVEPRVPILKVGQVKLSVAQDEAGTSMLANGGNYYEYWNRSYYGGNNRTFVQSASVTLAWPSKNSRMVKTVKGVIPVTLLSEQKPVVVCDSILASKGKKIKVGTANFNIDDVTTANKQHNIKITYNDESGENPYDYGRIGTIQQRLELQDAKGNKIPANVQIYQWGQNNAQLSVITQGAPNAKIGPPAKLVYQLWIQLEHEVPFEFKDLPLP